MPIEFQTFFKHSIPFTNTYTEEKLWIPRKVEYLGWELYSFKLKWKFQLLENSRIKPITKS